MGYNLILFDFIIVPPFELGNHFFAVYHVLLRLCVFQLFCFAISYEVFIEELNILDLVYLSLEVHIFRYMVDLAFGNNLLFLLRLLDHIIIHFLVSFLALLVGECGQRFADYTGDGEQHFRSRRVCSGFRPIVILRCD